MPDPFQGLPAEELACFSRSLNSTWNNLEFGAFVGVLLSERTASLKLQKFHFESSYPYVPKP